MEFDISAELEEMAKRRAEEFEKRKAEKTQWRADHLERRKYGKATYHRAKLARAQAERNDERSGY